MQGFDIESSLCYLKAMTQATIEKRINRTAEELQELVAKSKRKLLELEVVLSLNEMKRGEFEIFKTAGELFKKLK